VSLEVRAGFHHALGSRPALSGTRLHELVDALAASLVDEEVVGALAALAGVDSLLVPQPLDWTSSAASTCRTCSPGTG
ncbi:hypothetical protein ADL00_26060, partial [Streptomyces sp. AS58]|uniref:hypothetical protein n=1 Tax=Streptomyces sp. AS58 TaxID=1519489 RepID=UPI0006C3B4B1